MSVTARRRLQFGLRTVLACVLLLSAVLSWSVSLWRSAKRQERIVDTFNRAGVLCYYDSDFEDAPYRPDWLVDVLGRDMVSSVVWIEGEGSEFTDEHLATA